VGTGVRPPWHRALILAVAAGVALLLVLGVVFSVAYGSRQITATATALHKADETLRSATVARAQLALAVHMAAVDREVGTDSTDALNVSKTEARTALSEITAGLASLAEDNESIAARIAPSARQFVTEGTAVLDALDAGDSLEASQLAESELDGSFQSLTGGLVAVRDALATSMSDSDKLLGFIGNIARFLVAFLIPGAVILLYREIVRRQQRQIELETRLDAEREVSKARDDFIANASHELRTPLTGIHGLAMLLADEPVIQQSQIGSELIDLIITESTDLARMIEDLLTTARLDAGALQYTFGDVDIVNEIKEASDPLIYAGMNITIDAEPAMVRADQLRLRQVLRNLLSNAKKYGGPDVRVYGSVNGPTYTCAVIDDGAGIPEELEDHIFERFIHKGRQTATAQSVGLGLSIVRSLIEAMGGTIVYRREFNETAFVITLPMVKDSRRARRADTAEAISSL
jgi:signal transduction histidine kinase